MERSGSGLQIFAPLGARRRRNSSHTRRSASAPSSTHLLWWHRPHPSQVDIRRAAEDSNACGPPRTEAEIAPSKIDFCVRARATEPAPAPASVAPRGCPLSLRCAHRAQDGRGCGAASQDAAWAAPEQRPLTTRRRHMRALWLEPALHPRRSQRLLSKLRAPISGSLGPRGR